MLEAWLIGQMATIGADPDHLVIVFEERCREIMIEPPSSDRVDRIIRATVSAHDERFYTRIRDQLAAETRARLEALLRPAIGGSLTPQAPIQRWP